MTQDPHDLDARWRDVLAQMAEEEPARDNVAWMQSHRPADPELAAQAEVLTALRSLGTSAPASSDRAIVDRVAQQHAEEHEQHRGRRWVAVSLVAATAAAVLVWLSTSTPALEPTDSAPSVARAIPPEAKAETPTPEPTVTAPASPRVAGFRLETGALKAESADVVVAREPTCLHAEGAQWCLKAGARVRSGGTRPTQLLSGSSQLTVQAPLATPVVFEVAGARYEASVEVSVDIAVADGVEPVVVQSGSLQRIASDGTKTAIRAATAQRNPRRTPRPDAATMLSQARTLRAAGDRAGAIEAYEALVSSHPKAPVARAARVTLGELYLASGQANKALRSYERYLRRSGALAEEAQYGRIRALRALGRTADADAATASFLSRYPSSSYAPRLR